MARRRIAITLLGAVLAAPGAAAEALLADPGAALVRDAGGWRAALPPRGSGAWRLR